MPEIAYKAKCFRKLKLITIAQAREIVEEYQEDGFNLTLRQLYYQFVRRDLFPEERRWVLVDSKWRRDPDGSKNAEPNYKWLGDAVNDARLAGLLDWEAIVDRTRKRQGVTHWESPVDIVDAAVESYRIDKWETQPNRIEVWVEKEALAEIVERAVTPLDVDFMCCRGYLSQSAMWRAAQRLIIYEECGYDTFVLHLGDHDPSGVDMTRDNQERLHLFQSDVEVLRIALTMDQIEKLSPPPDPTKASDPRGTGYVERFGDEAWELDALEPRYLLDLITNEVEKLRDGNLWDEAVEKEESEIAILKKAANKIGI